MVGIADAVNIADLAGLARRRLPRVVSDYLDGGAEDEVTLRANRHAFEAWRLVPRILRGAAERDLSIRLFGQDYQVPFLIAPTGLNAIHWPEGDLVLAREAAAAGAGFVLSTAANTALEEVAQAAPGLPWFQLYPWGDRAFSARLIARAEAAGYRALMVTIDSLTPGKRERDRRNSFSHEVRLTPRVVLDGLRHPRWLASVWLGRGMPRLENLAEILPGASAAALSEFTRRGRNPGYNWDDIAWVRSQWRGPLLVKGVLSAEDALRAAAAGLDGIVVSNHGGRQLDGAPATLEALPEIVAAAGARLTILIDGGFRRGSDIVKALALGAEGVLLGRATLYGLAAGGPAGVAAALAILRDEVDRVLALLGCPAIGALGRGHLRPAVAVDAASAANIS